MRKIYSGNTNKEMPMDGSSGFKTDVQIYPDGEGGVFLSMCWHEMLTLGSALARIPPDKVQAFIHAIQDASEDVDNA